MLEINKLFIILFDLKLVFSLIYYKRVIEIIILIKKLLFIESIFIKISN